MVVHVRHGNGLELLLCFEAGYDLRDLLLTPDQIRLRLNIENKMLKILLVGVRVWLTWPSLQVRSNASYSVAF